MTYHKEKTQHSPSPTGTPWANDALETPAQGEEGGTRTRTRIRIRSLRIPLEIYLERDENERTNEQANGRHEDEWAMGITPAISVRVARRT